jgi:hypothetical protein
MTDDHRNIPLQQLANIVIDAYLNRDKQFVPNFESGTIGIIYLSQPEDDKIHPDLKTNVWYDRCDYEPDGAPDEEEPQNSRKK